MRWAQHPLGACVTYHWKKKKQIGFTKNWFYVCTHTTTSIYVYVYSPAPAPSPSHILYQYKEVQHIQVYIYPYFDPIFSLLVHLWNSDILTFLLIGKFRTILLFFMSISEAWYLALDILLDVFRFWGCLSLAFTCYDQILRQLISYYFWRIKFDSKFSIKVLFVS